jgi:hypothetical protein
MDGRVPEHPTSSAQGGPCVRGAGFDSVLQDVRDLIAADQISEEQLAAHLEPADYDYLEQKMDAAGWYPVGSYRRFLELLCATDSNTSAEAYLIQRGAIAAERLRALGSFPMLEIETSELGVRALGVFITIADTLYNFTRWTGEPDEDGTGYTVTVEDAADYPDAARYVAQGFLERGAVYVTSNPVLVSSQRPTPDRVIFRFEFGGVVE